MFECLNISHQGIEKSPVEWVPSIKQGLHLPKNERSTSIFVHTPFHTPCLQGIVCYTLQVYCRTETQPSPAGEGGPRQRWMRSQFGFRTPHPSTFDRHIPPLGKAFWCALKLHLLFLASTVLVDTKAKCAPIAQTNSQIYVFILSSISFAYLKACSASTSYPFLR